MLEAHDELGDLQLANADAQRFLQLPAGVQLVHESPRIHQGGGLRVGAPHRPPGGSVHERVSHSHKAVRRGIGEACVDLREEHGVRPELALRLNADQPPPRRATGWDLDRVAPRLPADATQQLAD
eukprot:5157390-Alexandrium_andersonii.AAC.1